MERTPDIVPQVPRILFDDGSYKITFHDLGSDTLVVTFDPMFVFARDSKGFGLKFLMDLGYSVVTVSKYRESYYQGLHPDALAAAVNAIARVRTFTYGSSLGGYAALFFSGVLDASAISISPRLSPHPVVRAVRAARDKNKVQLEHPVQFASEISPREHLVLYDPADRIDGPFVAATLGSLPTASFVRAYHFGHPVGQPLARIGMLKAMVTAFLLEGTRPGRSFRERKGQSARYLTNMSEKALQLGHAGRALALLEQAVPHAEADELPRITRLRFKALRKLGRHEEAIRSYASLTLTPGDYSDLARAHAALQRFDQALPLIDRALAIKPSANLFRYKAEILRDASHAVLLEGLAFYPNDEGLKLRLKSTSRRR